MSFLDRLASFSRPFALALTLGASLSLAACGGGGGGGDGEDDEAPIRQISAAGIPDLDGLVYLHDGDEFSRPDEPPVVGDESFNPNTVGPTVAVGFYAFDVAALPADAEIVSATMRFYVMERSGDPQEMMVLMRVDHVNYGSVFPQTRFGSQMLDANFAQVEDLLTIGYRDVDVTEQLQADVEAGRSTSQYRLRGAINSDSDADADYLTLNDAEDNLGNERVPVLLIQYR